MSGQTQIVLQWLESSHSDLSLDQIHKIEDNLEQLGNGRFFVDGHDVGSGTINVFIYAEDAQVDAAIALIIRYFEQGKLPKGLRIGRAVYEDAKRTNWTFHPAYPPGLGSFDIMYPEAGPPR